MMILDEDLDEGLDMKNPIEINNYKAFDGKHKITIGEK